MTAFSRPVQRVIVVGAAFLAHAARGNLVRALDAQLATVAGTNRLAAGARARASYLASSLTHWTSPTSDQAPVYSLVFRVLEILGRLPLWVGTLPFRGPLSRASAARSATMVALTQGELGAAPRARGRASRDEPIGSFVRDVLRPLTSIGVLVRDPLAAFEQHHGTRDLDPLTRPRLLDGGDPLATAYEETLDSLIRADLEDYPWQALAAGAHERVVRAHAKLVAERLPSRRRRPRSAARTFVAIVEALSSGEGLSVVARLDPRLIDDVSVRAPARYNHALARALGCTLATALLDRGGELADPFVTRAVAVDLDGERVDVFRIVDDALTRSSGAAVLDEWARRLRIPPRETEPDVEREAPAVDEATDNAPAAPETSDIADETEAVADDAHDELTQAARPVVAALSEAARARLVRANRRVTRGALLLLAAFALASVAALPLSYGLLAFVRFGAGDDEDLTGLLSPKIASTLAVLVVFVAVVATTGPLPERTALDTEPSKRLRRMITEAARRHDTHEPDIIELVEDRSNLPLVALTDHTQWLFGQVERTLHISEAVAGKAAHDELDDLLDRAFAGVAGTGRLAASIRGRASCVRHVNGRMHRLPDEPSQWWAVLAAVRAMSFVIARPAGLVMARFERDAGARVVEALEGGRGASAQEAGVG